MSIEKCLLDINNSIRDLVKVTRDCHEVNLQVLEINKSNYELFKKYYSNETNLRNLIYNFERINNIIMNSNLSDKDKLLQINECFVRIPNADNN